MKWGDLEELKFDTTMNLWSYTALKGAYILSLKMKEGEREEKKYAEGKRVLLDEISVATKHLSLNPVKEY